MENKRQHPRKRGSATNLASIGRDAVNNIDVVRHRCVALDARKPMTMGGRVVCGCLSVFFFQPGQPCFPSTRNASFSLTLVILVVSDHHVSVVVHLAVTDYL